MEAELVGRKPNFIIRRDPRLYLEGTNYLDPEDPLDACLVAYEALIADDDIPTAARQRDLITGVKNSDLASARELLDSHMGLVAAVAYPFKHGVNSDELLCAGRRVLLQAAGSYDKTFGADFNDYSATLLHEAFSELVPDAADTSFLGLPGRPMENVYRFMETVVPADTEPKRQEMRRQTLERVRLTSEEMHVLQHIHLTAKDASEQIGTMSRYEVAYWRASIKEKMGAETIEEVALRGLEAGMVYDDVREAPPIETLTLTERQIATRLWRSNDAITEELGLSYSKLESLLTSLRAKTGARTRTEMLVMAYTHDFEPTELELDPPPPPVLEQMTPLQRRVLQLSLYMSNEEIGRVPGIDKSGNAVGFVIRNFAKKAGLPHNNRTALILDLYEEGLDFEVTEPEKPLEEVLYAHELAVSQELHLSREEIIEKLGWNIRPERISEIIYEARRRAGARSQQELALMVRMFYDGSPALEINRDDNRWRLAQRLGLTALGDTEARILLDRLNPAEKRAVSAYYLGERAVTWEEVGRELGVNRKAAQAASLRGLRRIRKQIAAAD